MNELGEENCTRIMHHQIFFFFLFIRKSLLFANFFSYLVCLRGIYHMYGVSPFLPCLHATISFPLIHLNVPTEIRLGACGRFSFTRAIHEKKNSYYIYRLGVNHTFYQSINQSINLPLHGHSIFLPECSF